jgi:hypothetical protein
MVFHVYTTYCHKDRVLTHSDNLIPGMAAACHWGESGKLMHPSMSGHVPTCVYMNRRPNESFVPKQQRKQYMSMSEKNLEQWINMKFRVKIGKCASETLDLITVAYSEYAMKKLSIFDPRVRATN